MLDRHEVKQIASNNQWRCVKGKKNKPTSPTMLEFTKVAMRIIVDLEMHTVETILNHPRYGWTCLMRGGVDYKLLTHIFHNPRVHTDRGLYIKRERN